MPELESTGSHLRSRLVRYDELIPCTTAFVDTRTPGSERKENFTIIGPGVSENPDQHVHIELPHGFNIGGARQPPKCVNSQHSHATAEVFVVHSGTWAFYSGETAQDGKVVLYPGDTISIPTHAFRGFENIGDDMGFLFAVLGGDDPGRVTWAPYVFEQAKSHGLVLLENGRLIDTASGEQVPSDVAPMPPTTKEDIAALQRLDTDALERCVVLRTRLQPATASLLTAAGLEETPIIGEVTAETDEVEVSAGSLRWPHGFQLRHLQLEGGYSSAPFVRDQEEVYLMHRGELCIEVEAETLTLTPGDVFTVPVGAQRRLHNRHAEPCEAYVVHGSDAPRGHLCHSA